MWVVLFTFGSFDSILTAFGVSEVAYLLPPVASLNFHRFIFSANQGLKKP